MTFSNNFDLDEALQKVEPHLRLKLFDTKFLYTCSGKNLDGNKIEREKINIIS